MTTLQHAGARCEPPSETWRLAREHAAPLPEWALHDALGYFIWHDNLTPANMTEAQRFAADFDLDEQAPEAMDERLALVRAEVAADKLREVEKERVWMTDQKAQFAKVVELMAKRPRPTPAEIDRQNQALANRADLWTNSNALAGKAPAAPEPWIVRDVSDIFAPLEPVKYLLETLDICAGAPTLCAGYGFSGKTVTVQSMAVSIAAGQKVWGVYTARQGRVLHIDYEQGFRLTRERYQRLAAGMMVTPDELQGRLHVVPMPQVYLDNPTHEAFLTKQVEGYDMAIVDSLRACGPSIEENDSSVRGLLDMLNRISDKTGCCFIVIHHARKPARDGASAGGAKMAIRGSGAIFDACSSVVILEAEKGKPTKVTHEKARTSGITSDDFLIKVEDQEVGGNPRGGLVVLAESCPMAASASGAFDALKKRVLTELASGAAASKTALAARVTGNLQAKYAAIAQLVEDGAIVENGKRLQLPR